MGCEQRKPAVHAVFVLFLLLAFILLFGYPAVRKFWQREVFIKVLLKTTSRFSDEICHTMPYLVCRDVLQVSEDPAAGDLLRPLLLPAVTLCASAAQAVISQVRRVTPGHASTIKNFKD